MLLKNEWLNISLLYPIGDYQEKKLLAGGLLHQVYWLQTSTGNYALKLLDPWIVSQQNLSHWNTCELIAKNFFDKHIPAVHALQNLTGNYLSQFNDQYFMVYHWIKSYCHPARAKCVAGSGIIESQTRPRKTLCVCGVTQRIENIGTILAHIHSIQLNKTDYPQLNIPSWNGFDEQHWENLLEKYDTNFDIQKLLKINNTIRNVEIKLTEKDIIISHRDLDPRNVIWQNERPFIIDWEYAGLITPTLDLLIVAFNFAGLSLGKTPKIENFRAVVKGYEAKRESVTFDNQNKILYLGYCLDWLEFNLRRWLAQTPKRPQIDEEIKRSWWAIQWIYQEFDDFMSAIYHTKL